MNYDTVIFDLDGTLLDSLEDLADSVNVVRKGKGLFDADLDQVRGWIGWGMYHLIRCALNISGSDDEIENDVQEFKRVYEIKMNQKTKPFPGILELLDELVKREVKLAVVSNKNDIAVKALCKTMFSNYNFVAIGEQKAIKTKPAPDSTLEAIKQLHSQKEKTLYVGDSEVDVETARNAGIHCVGAAWGYRGEAILRQAGARYIIQSPTELLNLL